ncbi:MAG: C25 family cysteine peptidase, partial [Candidatus Thermoplasmatota archaeon]|nr:C25 family cysteine peptidase [Candidatus Thermoplasmatota archaeon]
MFRRRSSFLIITILAITSLSGVFGVHDGEAYTTVAVTSGSEGGNTGSSGYMCRSIAIPIEFHEPQIAEGPFGNEILVPGLSIDDRPSFRRAPVRTLTFDLELGSSIENIHFSNLLTGRARVNAPISCNPHPMALSGLIDHDPIDETIQDPIDHIEWSMHTGMDENGGVASHLVVRLYPVLLEDEVMEFISSAVLNIEYTVPMHDAVSSVFTGGTYDMLIICPSEFRSRIDEFAGYRNKTGINTIPVDLGEIRSGEYFTIDGNDSQEEIKRFIYNARKEWGIEYVMLAGDVDKVPARHILVLDGYDDSGAGNRDGAFVPSDLYYSDLFRDGTLDYSSWNSYTTGDHRYLWGEYDGSALDTPDLLPDVYLGRVPAGDLDELDLMLRKITDYELSAKGSSWAMNATLGGTDPFSGDTTPEGEFLCDHLESNYLMDHNISKFYESYGNLGNVTFSLRNHTGLAILSDHGDYDGWGYTSNYSGVINTNYLKYTMDNANELPLMIVDACLTHGFDNENASDESTGKDPIYNQWYYPPGSAHKGRDSLGEWFHKAEGGGAIATFGSTRVAYGSPGATYPNALSGYMAKHLTRAMVEGNDTPGKMLAAALTDYVTELGTPTHEDYKTVTQYVLLGDPSVTIGGIDPVELDIDVQENEMDVLPGSETNITFSIENVGLVNASLDLDVEVIGNGAVIWTSNISMNRTEIVPSGIVNGEISIFVPGNTRAMQNRTVRIIVDSLLLLEPRTLDVLVTAERTEGVFVDLSPEELEALQGSEASGYFHIHNTGNGNELFFANFSWIPDGWTWFTYQTSFEAAPFEVVDVPFKITLPEKCHSGKYEPVLSVVSNVTGANFTRIMNLTVGSEISIAITIPEDTVPMGPGETCDVPIGIENMGNSLIRAVIDLSTPGYEGWGIDLSSDEIEID